MDIKVTLASTQYKFNVCLCFLDNHFVNSILMIYGIFTIVVERHKMVYGKNKSMIIKIKSRNILCTKTLCTGCIHTYMCVDLSFYQMEQF